MIEVLLGLMIAMQVMRYLLVAYFFRHNRVDFVPARGDRESSNMVSILQPILSGDPTLWNCLEANLTARSTYRIEWLWLVDQNDAVGLAGCRALIDRFPSQHISLLLSPISPDGVNPKMAKLIQGEKAATGNILVVLDDDTVLTDDALEQCLGYLADPSNGLVFGLPYYKNYSNLWSSLVSNLVNANSILTYVPYTFFISPITINGMFYAVLHDRLRQVGGFEGLETELCDDYAVARRMAASGLRLKQTTVRHAISSQINTFSHYHQLVKRWFIFPQVSILKQAEIRHLIVFVILVLLPVFFPLAAIILALFRPSLWPYAGVYWIVHAGILTAINHRYLNGVAPLFGLLSAQLIVPLHVIWALFAPRTINWRGHIIQILPDNQIHFVRRKTSSS